MRESFPPAVINFMAIHLASYTVHHFPSAFSSFSHQVYSCHFPLLPLSLVFAVHSFTRYNICSACTRDCFFFSQSYRQLVSDRRGEKKSYNRKQVKLCIQRQNDIASSELIITSVISLDAPVTRAVSSEWDLSPWRWIEDSDNPARGDSKSNINDRCQQLKEQSETQLMDNCNQFIHCLLGFLVWSGTSGSRGRKHVPYVCNDFFHRLLWCPLIGFICKQLQPGLDLIIPCLIVSSL